MSRLLRLSCLWLIAVALPLQGMAAAWMLACAAAHAIPAPTAMSMPAAHQHHPSMAPVSAADGTMQHEHAAAAHTRHGHADKAGCAVCAACCLSAGITPTPPCLPPPAAVAAHLHAPEQTERASPSLGGLERPPRFLLA